MGVQRTKDGNTPLHMVMYMDVNTKGKSYSFGSSKSEKNKLITQIRQMEITKTLIEQKAPLDVKNTEGFSPVFLAYELRLFDLVKVLVEKGMCFCRSVGD